MGLECMTNKKRKVMILGCSGSIGTSALRGLGRFSDLFELVAVSVHHNVEAGYAVARQWPLKAICISSDDLCEPMTQDVRVYRGAQGLLDMIRDTEADVVLNAIMGTAGLEATFAAIESHKDVALANKESIVMAGNLVLDAAKRNDVRIIPVDSEHAALDALIRAHGKQAVKTLVLTASGGPFRTLEASKFDSITIKQALSHPTWSMGKKISIDSATLANKGLELIEAAILFGIPSDCIEVVIHPQSIVHSLIRTVDGALYGQISRPDMVHPIMMALGRDLPLLKDVIMPLDLHDLSLSFSTLDQGRFPMVTYAKRCIDLGNSYPIAFTIANEYAVDLFLGGTIRFPAISKIVERVLDYDWSHRCLSVESITACSRHVREITESVADAFIGV